MPRLLTRNSARERNLRGQTGVIDRLAEEIAAINSIGSKIDFVCQLSDDIQQYRGDSCSVLS